jgi:hypothetical protein
LEETPLRDPSCVGVAGPWPLGDDALPTLRELARALLSAPPKPAK